MDNSVDVLSSPVGPTMEEDETYGTHEEYRDKFHTERDLDLDMSDEEVSRKRKRSLSAEERDLGGSVDAEDKDRPKLWEIDKEGQQGRSERGAEDRRRSDRDRAARERDREGERSRERFERDKDRFGRDIRYDDREKERAYDDRDRDRDRIVGRDRPRDSRVDDRDRDRDRARYDERYDRESPANKRRRDDTYRDRSCPPPPKQEGTAPLFASLYLIHSHNLYT